MPRLYGFCSFLFQSLPGNHEPVGFSGIFGMDDQVIWSGLQGGCIDPERAFAIAVFEQYPPIRGTDADKRFLLLCMQVNAQDFPNRVGIDGGLYGSRVEVVYFFFCHGYCNCGIGFNQYGIGKWFIVGMTDPEWILYACIAVIKHCHALAAGSAFRVSQFNGGTLNRVVIVENLHLYIGPPGGERNSEGGIVSQYQRSGIGEIFVMFYGVFIG